MVTYQCHISLLHIESHITAFMKTFSCLTLHPMMGARHTSSLYEFMDGLAARSFSASLASTIIEGGATEGGRTRWAPPFIIPPLPFSCVVSPPFVLNFTLYLRERDSAFPSSSSYLPHHYISVRLLAFFMPYPRACDLMTVPYNKAYYGISRHDIALVHLIATHVSSARTIS